MINIPQIEKEILKFWQDHDIFNKLREKNKHGKRWSFLDGPITANNPMGVHHAWGRTLKDLFQRFHSMKGEKLRYQNGFDCQGLWVEVEVEKELKFNTKKDIEKYGIGGFVNKCKERAEKYSRIQTEQSKRLGYWMDWDNSYYTMSDENNYMIWHFLKKVWEQGELYKGRDSVPWCPRCGTAISQHEILSEEYKEITHQSIYFKLPVIENGIKKENEYFLVWTTTPWTLPANVALAVGEEIDYAKIHTNKNGEYYILAKDLLNKIFKSKDYKIVNEFKGKKLEKFKYSGPFDDLQRVQEAQKENPKTFHSIVSEKELVTTEEGTGIVHIAPGCGAEDFQLGKEKNLSVIDVIDEAANYLDDLGEFSKQNAKKNPEIIFNYLKNVEFNPIFKIEPYKHRYPTCWRCKQELVWRVVDEWYISMDKGGLRDKMMEVAKKINWIPKFGLDRELDWLKNMHDWLISKKRYWGLALPIWECECGHFEVIGSKQELKQKAFSGWKEFDGNSPHKPWIDKVKIKCSKCEKIISRIPDVGNPWLDAGIVPFSTFVDPKSGKLSYTSDKKYWLNWFPADFVTECFPGQFKNWFYSLIAMSTVLENTNPFKTLLGHALVKDEKGEEMHKSKGNAIWFDDAIEKMGADVMRWMYLSNNPTIDLRFGYHHGNEVKKQVFIPLLNIVNFFKMFVSHTNNDANISEYYANDFKKFCVLDKWIISKLNLLIKTVTKNLNEFKPSNASKELNDFVTELSVWYVRRSRERFKGEDQNDKNQAIYVLGRILFELTKLIAPFAPYIAEYIYQELGKECKSLKESVHLENWPGYKEEFIDQKILANMEVVRKIVELGLAKRAEAGIKVRQPLQELEIRNQKLGNEYLELIKDEVNIKKVVCEKGDGELAVELNIELTLELKQEGFLRELVRKINDTRKKMGLTIQDRIEIKYNTKDENLKNVFEKFGAELKKQTLADELSIGDDLEKIKINNIELEIGIEKR